MAGRQLELRLEVQSNPVADVVSALFAIVGPVLKGTLYGLKREVVEDAGGYENIKLRQLARLYRPGDGDCGICFEYAVHDALNTGDAAVVERVYDALYRCGLQSDIAPTSILFGAEKAGALQLIDTIRERFTDNSRLMSGSRGRPVSLKKHIDGVVSAFRKPSARKSLPSSISGLWKADLFTGFTDTDRWVGTSLKINPTDLRPAKGIRIGIVPSSQGASDAIEERGKLIVCPLPYDGAFVEVFYRAFGIVQQFIAADAMLPRPVALAKPQERYVAKYLEERREFPVVDVISALHPIAQPELLATEKRYADVQFSREAETIAQAVLAPVPRRPDLQQLELL